MKKLIFGVLSVAFLAACGGSNPAEKAATEYLNALKNKDFDKAKTLATKETAQNLDMMKSLGTDFGLTEVKDVKCTVKENEATCTFCCTKDTSFKELKLKKEGDKWLAHQPKETPPTTTEDTTTTVETDSLNTTMDEATTTEVTEEKK
jgi:hypothetical protein